MFQFLSPFPEKITWRLDNVIADVENLFEISFRDQAVILEEKMPEGGRGRGRGSPKKKLVTDSTNEFDMQIERQTTSGFFKLSKLIIRDGNNKKKLEKRFESLNV